jgi:hypothetical protein
MMAEAVKAAAVGHTPGPWRVSGIGTIESEGDNPECIASVMPRNLSENARLIAAAPCLLAALRRLVDHDMTYFRGFVADGQISQAAVMSARAAIAKAEGA